MKFSTLFAALMSVLIFASMVFASDHGLVREEVIILGPDGVGGIEILTISHWDNDTTTVVLSVIPQQ